MRFPPNNGHRFRLAISLFRTIPGIYILSLNEDAFGCKKTSLYLKKSVVASSLVLYFLLPYTHSVFMVPKKLSIGALSQQFPFLLMEPIIPLFHSFV